MCKAIASRKEARVTSSLQETLPQETIGPAKQRGVDLTVPAPLPDELARGMKGRFMRLNALRSEGAANKLLIEACSIPVDLTSGVSRVDVLADVVSLPRTDFICQHTMLPLRRAIAFEGVRSPYGSDADSSWRVPTMLAPDRPGAYFCDKCVAEDLDFHGVAYWRRDHQLPGRYCCGKHALPLRYSLATDSFLQSPLHFISSASRVREDWARSTEENEAVQRFLFLESELLARSTPLNAKAVVAMLRKECDRHGLHIGKGKRKRGKLLSEALIETYGSDWLETIVREFAPGVDGKSSRADEVNKRPSIGIVLAVFAMLFDDAQALLAQLVTISGGESDDTPSAPARGERTDMDALRRLYIRHEGCHRRIAAEIEKFPAHVKYNLDRVGLPTLSGQSLDQLDRQLQAFVNGQSIAQVCGDDSVRIESFESLLRRTALSLASAVRRMQTAKRLRKGLHEPPREQTQTGH